jgi:Protein of unknown function (DUF3379)
MNCLEYRRRVGAEPRNDSEELASHARGCPACAEFTQEMRQFDARIEAALRIPVPLWSAIGSISERWTRAPLALAASLFLAISVAAILWLTLPRSTLADELVEHVQHELPSLQLTATVPPEALARALDKSGVAVSKPLGRVTYAQSCRFRGHLVPHLVVDDGSGPVTVFLLEHEKVAKPEHFSEGGFIGVIVPARHGAVAVLTRDESQVAAIAERIAGSMGTEP